MSPAPAGTESPALPRDWLECLGDAPRILVVQRDNIGDLVLITPFLRALRSCLPRARIDVLVNSYNAEALHGNADVNQILVYVKAKHRPPSLSLLALYVERARLWWHLRAQNYHLAVLMNGRYAASSVRPARAARARHICGFLPSPLAPSRIDLGVTPNLIAAKHTVTRSAALLERILPQDVIRNANALPLAACQVVARAVMRERAVRACDPEHQELPVIAVHISARKPDQRWPADRFVALLHGLARQAPCRLVLLWAPGSSSNVQHPGDDEKAAQIMAGCNGLALTAYRTTSLAELIGVLGIARLLICSDGGAMHLAAAQGTPIVALFGNSDPAVWHPWGSPYVVLREPSEKAIDITLEAVMGAAMSLLGRVASSASDKLSQ